MQGAAAPEIDLGARFHQPWQTSHDRLGEHGLVDALGRVRENSDANPPGKGAPDGAVEVRRLDEIRILDMNGLAS